MEMTRDFIRDTIKDIKAEKDRVKNDLMSKFTMLESVIVSLGANLESGLRQNFPAMPLPPLIYTNPGVITIVDPVNIALDLLQGKSEIVTTFKRHIDFLKLITDPIKSERLDKTFNKYFVYWNDYYFTNTYVKKLSQDAMTKIPNPIRSLDRIYNVFGSNVKNNIKIRSSDLDIWGTNAPVVYSYNNNANMFDLEFDNSLTGTVGLTVINSCPELDINIGHAINRLYKSEFGFDYFKFEEVNDSFIQFITDLLTQFLLTRYSTWTEIKRKNEWEYGGIDLLYEQEFKLNFSDNKASMIFSFIQPKDDATQHPNKKFIEITIEDPKSISDCKIKVKLTGIYQTLHFSLIGRETPEAEVVFDGYCKNDNTKITDMVLHYFSEDYKLFVLYYGGLLLAKKEEMLLRMNNAITNRLTEQKGEEAINGNTVS